MTQTKTLRMAMVGIGVGGAEILPAMDSTPGIELRWGAATLEVALGIMQSAREHKDIQMNRQVAVPDWYDKDLSVPYLD